MKIHLNICLGIRNFLIKVFWLAILLILINGKCIEEKKDFVFMHKDRFYFHGDVFNPIVCNYSVEIISDLDHNFHISPSKGYCWENDCGVTCGSNVDEWHNEIAAHLHKIKNMGFNSVRIIGLSVEYDESNDKLVSKDYYQQKPDGCYSKVNRYFIEDTNIVVQGNLIEEFINIIKRENLPLKIILLVTGHGAENKDAEAARYLSYIAKRFKDEPVIFSYDLYNEPSLFGYPKYVLKGKYKTAHTTSLWYNAIKRKAPLHHVTIGLHVVDVLDWDPGILSVDYISLHTYPHIRGEENWVYDSVVFNRYLSGLKYVSRTYEKPWIIGETGYSAVDAGLIHPIVGSEEEQRSFAESSLKYAFWYGALGYSWWMFKDVSHYSDQTASANQNYFGLVRRYSNSQEHKPAAEEFMNFIPGANCLSCTDPPDSLYYNPYSYNNSVLEGVVKDAQGAPIPDAYVWVMTLKDTIIDSKQQYLYRPYSTFSQNSGIYKVFGRGDSSSLHQIRISYPGLELYDSTTWNYNPIIPGSIAPSVDVILNPLDPGSLPKIP
jgi:hypothetical protein